MATYAAYLRDTGVDGTTIIANPDKTISANGPMQPTGRIYYVDGNRVVSGDGRTWETAFQKLSEALLVSHANISSGPPARNWAGRNTIYFKGDDTGASGNQEEDLTKLAQKTDVIGVGTALTLEAARLKGHHIINVPGSGNYAGCKLYNIAFAPDGSEPMVTIPLGQHGIGFFNCTFEGTFSCTTGILATAINDFHVEGCHFRALNAGGAYSTGCISVGTGNTNNMIIKNNIMLGQIGITIHGTQIGDDNWIIGNFIVANTLAIDDNSNTFFIIDNRWISKTQSAASSHDLSILHSVGNIATGTDHTDTVPLATVTA